MMNRMNLNDLRLNDELIKKVFLFPTPMCGTCGEIGAIKTSGKLSEIKEKMFKFIDDLKTEYKQANPMGVIIDETRGKIYFLKDKKCVINKNVTFKCNKISTFKLDELVIDYTELINTMATDLDIDSLVIAQVINGNLNIISNQAFLVSHR